LLSQQRDFAADVRFDTEARHARGCAENCDVHLVHARRPRSSGFSLIAVFGLPAILKDLLAGALIHLGRPSFCHRRTLVPGMVVKKPLELPPAVVRRFMDDVRAYFATERGIKRNEIAAR
jgi:hypothetical protein